MSPPGPLWNPSNPFQNMFHYYWEPGPSPPLEWLKLILFVITMLGLMRWIALRDSLRDKNDSTPYQD
ncbi:MAG: hypothetical protein ACFFDT_34835 [Candidatus Hodarchaeota archaeon]